LVGGGAEVEGGEDAGALTADESGCTLGFLLVLREMRKGGTYCVGTGAAVIVVLS
jgi:hypothetical protein